ncbi:unnamed protein product [Peniophora sp. CBMAI 1063]|nr:unnamed protein product [Peniophora sp. CBMAI 1063]
MAPHTTDMNARDVAARGALMNSWTSVNAPPFPLPGISASHGRSSSVHELHERHDHCPESLLCLLDTHQRPPYPTALIIRAAILGSRERRLALTDIFTAIQEKYPYFRASSAERTMKQAVEFELSIHDMFRRQKATPDGPWLWKVDLGVHIPSLHCHSSGEHVGIGAHGVNEGSPSFCCQRRARSPLGAETPCSPSHQFSPPPRDPTPLAAIESLVGSVEVEEAHIPSWRPSVRDIRLLLEDDTHPRHPGCPDALSCLEDMLVEPRYTVPVMIRCTILSASDRKLSTHQICETLKIKYPYFQSRDAERKLNKDVRKNLSKCPLFVRTSEKCRSPGSANNDVARHPSASFWTVDLSVRVAMIYTPNPCAASRTARRQSAE